MNAMLPVCRCKSWLSVHVVMVAHPPDSIDHQRGHRAPSNSTRCSGDAGPEAIGGPSAWSRLVYGSGRTGRHTAVSGATLHGPSARCGPGGMVCGFRFRNLLRCADQVGHVGDLALLRVDDQARHVLGGWAAAVPELGLRHGHRALVMADHRGNPHRVELGAGQ